MEKRLGSIEIGGDVYPLNFSVRVSQAFNDLGAQKAESTYEIQKQNIQLLLLLLQDGAEYSRVILGKEISIPTLEQMELLLSPADNERVVQAILETMELGGMRLVQAKPKKKEGQKP